MSLTYHIDVVCDTCGAVFAYATSGAHPRATAAVLRTRERGWTHSAVRDLCPTCRPKPRNRLHHRKDVPHA